MTSIKKHGLLPRAFARSARWVLQRILGMIKAWRWFSHSVVDTLIEILGLFPD